MKVIIEGGLFQCLVNMKVPNEIQLEVDFQCPKAFSLLYVEILKEVYNLKEVANS